MSKKTEDELQDLYEKREEIDAKIRDLSKRLLRERQEASCGYTRAGFCTREKGHPGAHRV